MDLIKNVPGLAAVMGGAATLVLGNSDGSGLDVSPDVVDSSYVEVMDQLEGSAAKRAREEVHGVAPDVTNEEEIAGEESAKIEEKLRLVQLSKKAAKEKAKKEAKAAAMATAEGEAMNVEEAGALIDYREPCEHGSNLPGHNSGLYGNGCNGISYYGRPVNVEAGGQQDENEHGEGYNDYILPLMVWLLVVIFVYARRTTRLLGRRFASVHKARRRTAVSICDRRSVNLRTGQWFGWFVAVIFYGLFALRLCCLDTTPWKHNEQLLLIDLCADFGGITVFRTKANFQPATEAWLGTSRLSH